MKFRMMVCALALMASSPALAQEQKPATPAPVAAAAPAPAIAVELQSEETFYKYAHNDGEYSVMLPEAPRVMTIWADDGNPIPYLENPPKEGALGEIATFRRVDQKTEDSFEVKITFLKAPADFLSGLTEGKIKAMLEGDYKDAKLEVNNWYYSAGANGLKWATLSGFNVDENNRAYYSAGHFLTGKQSILVVQVKYGVENPVFADYYKKMTDNITYLSQ